MRNKGLLACLLALVMLLSLLPVTAMAIDGEGTEPVLTEEESLQPEEEKEVEEAEKVEEIEKVEEVEEAAEVETEVEPQQLSESAEAPLLMDSSAAEPDYTWYTADAATYTISSAAQLLGLADIVNGTATSIAADTFKGKKITLGSDIDLTGINWIPIGLYNADKDFLGEFDGNKKTISHLTITPSSTGNAKLRLGLFASPVADIHNLTLKDTEITQDNPSADARVGALGGNLWDDDTTGCKVRNVVIDGFIFNGFANKFGGLCGNAFQLTAENVTVKNVNATFCEKAECAANTATTSDILAGMFAFGNGNHFTNCAVINITFDVRYKTQTNRFVAVGGFAGEANGSGGYSTFDNCDVSGIDFKLYNNPVYYAGGFYGKNSGHTMTFDGCDVSGKIQVLGPDANGKTGIGGFTGMEEYYRGNKTYRNCVAEMDLTSGGTVGGFVGILQDAGAYPTNERNGFYENCTTKGSMNTGDASDVKVGTFVGAMKKPAPGVTVKGCTAQSTWDGGKEAPYIEKAESGEKESTPYAVLAYDANGFFTTNMPQMVIVECEGESLTLIISDETMVRDGYTFQGWNTSADGTGTSYKANDEITVYKPGETLYAQWKADPTPGHGNRPTHHDPTDTSTDGNVTSAKTFDAGIALHVGMSVLSLTGSALVVTKKKRG